MHVVTKIAYRIAMGSWFVMVLATYMLGLLVEEGAWTIRSEDIAFAKSLDVLGAIAGLFMILALVVAGISYVASHLRFRWK
ncbi:MAG: hypothetical protein QG636_301 [Patescibacteria group bacterium]|nr:hypothetical protein [Patescibacteria group bacterium]